MTRHSTLTNPNDLHYAKIKTFTGDSALITPDFVDQILTATDTNKVYRANSNIQGGLIELVPQIPVAGNGAGNGANAWLTFADSFDAQVCRSHLLTTNIEGNYTAKFPIATEGAWVEFGVISGQAVYLFLDTNSQMIVDYTSNIYSGQKFPELIYDNPNYWNSIRIDDGSNNLHSGTYFSFATFLWTGSFWQLIDGKTYTSSTAPSGWGCTDPNANNYDPNAIYDDGTCSFP